MVSVEQAGSFVLLRVSGEIDIATAPHLRAALTEVQRVGADAAVDLSAVEFLDSTGLHVFVEAHRRAADSGARFVLIGVHDGPRRIMGLVGLDEVLSLVPDLDALLSRGR